MDKLAAYFYDQGKDVKKVFSELNSHGAPIQGTAGDTLMRDVTADGGTLTCIENGKISVSVDPKDLGKNANLLLKNMQKKSLLNNFIADMKALSSDEKITTYAYLKTNIPNPANKMTPLLQKNIVVAYGRNALLKERLDKNQHSKFVCYIAYPVS